MWLERIIEAKQRQNISSQTMSERSRIPANTIKRILAGKTDNPYITTVLALGASVGLSAMELFAETTSVLGDNDLATLQKELDLANNTVKSLTEEVARLTDENGALRDKVVSLTTQNSTHKDEIIALYKEIVSLHNKKA